MGTRYGIWNIWLMWYGEIPSVGEQRVSESESQQEKFSPFLPPFYGAPFWVNLG